MPVMMDSPEQQNCPFCQAEIQPGDNFCRNCGNRLTPASSSAKTSTGSAKTIDRPARFVLRSEDGEELHTYMLDKPEITIGRAPSSDILLSKDKLTSRRHATVRYENGNYYLRDEQSANGTFLNGQLIEEMTPHLLKDGDHVGIGEYELVFHNYDTSLADVEDMPTVAVSDSPDNALRILMKGQQLGDYRLIDRLSEPSLVRQQLGNYRLIRLLREDDFGHIYLGEHISTHEQARVSVLQDLREDKLARFRKEIAIHTRLRHPHILPLIEDYTLYKDEAIPFFTTAFTPHGTLAEQYPRGTHVPLPTIVSYVKQVADALQYIHNQGYMHLNVKPDLLFIEDNEEILLGSFAVAATIGDTGLAGTPLYMAPEQFEGKPVPASDQYGLAISVYEWLAGTPPFNGTTFEELRRQHLSMSPPSLQEQDKTIPFAIEVVVRQALSKDPQDRFATIQTFADALERVYLQSLKPEDFVGRQLGSYRLVSFLRQSDFGNIYLGEHVTTHEQAVVKVLRDRGIEELTRFRREIHIHSSMHHPNILPYIESDTDSAFPFLTTAFAPYSTLAQRHTIGEPVPLGVIISYVRQVSVAVQYMHEQGYMHLNVNPTSLYIGANEEILLGSFAIADNAIRPEGIHPSGVLAYMAPEQFEGRPIPASDQYSLGITLYQWLCGTLPFQSTSFAELRRQHTSMTPPSLREQDESISLAVESVIMKALAKNPQDRFATIQEFADALEKAAALYNSPTVPLPEPTPISQTISYQVFIATTPSTSITIGNTIQVALYLTSIDEEYDTVGYTFEVPYDEVSGSELNILLNAPGFQLSGENAASLPLVLPVGDATPQTQVARFLLVALRPGMANVSAEVYHGTTFLTTLDADVEVTGIDDEQAHMVDTSLLVRPRPVPQPDLLLQVRTEWSADMSSCVFHYTLRSFQAALPLSNESHQSPWLSTGWIERSRRMLGDVLEECAGASVEDTRMQLISLGSFLFRTALPLTLQNELHDLARVTRPLSLLIVSDQDAWLPWELLHMDHGFLGEQFVMSRWLHELDASRPYEFPIGSMHVAYYANVPQPEAWVDLLTFPELPDPLLLPGGVFVDLASAEAMRSLYLLRYTRPAEENNRQNAPVRRELVNGQNSVEQEFRPAKLSLRRNRPLVSLGYVSTETSELTMLEQAWIPTFVHAGCSAFVGPLWSVQPGVQAAFMSGFYRRLWAGEALAEAFQTGRLLAKAVAPESLDWLAYVLIGDPMARPYRPIAGQGYALIEPIGHELADPLLPGDSMRFRLSLRRTPPVWHEERVIEVAETLHFEHLQVYVVTFGLEITPEPPIEMTLLPNGDYLGWCTLQVPAEMGTKKVPVQVHFVDDMQPIHSLSFTLKIEAQEDERT